MSRQGMIALLVVAVLAGAALAWVALRSDDPAAGPRAPAAVPAMPGDSRAGAVASGSPTVDPSPLAATADAPAPAAEQETPHPRPDPQVPTAAVSPSPATAYPSAVEPQQLRSPGTRPSGTAGSPSTSGRAAVGGLPAGAESSSRPPASPATAAEVYVEPPRSSGTSSPPPAAAESTRGTDSSGGTSERVANRPSPGGDAASRRRDDEGAREAAAPPQVAMIPSAAVVGVGQPLIVSIALFGGTDVGHVPFHVVFDPSVLRFESGQEGGFLAGDGNPTAFFAAATSAGDAVVVGLSRLGRVGGIDGDGELCVLQFTALGPGEAGLAFARAKVRDSTNRIVPSLFVPARVTVQ